MRPCANYPECHLCRRHLLVDSRRVRAAPGRKWAPKTWLALLLVVANTGPTDCHGHRSAGGSAAITRRSLMLLMRESPPRRPARPRGAAAQRQVNLSWQTVHHAAHTLACAHPPHMHRFIKIHTFTDIHTHKKIPIATISLFLNTQTNIKSVMSLLWETFFKSNIWVLPLLYFLRETKIWTQKAQ